MTEPTPRKSTFAGISIKKPSELAQHQGICLTLTGKGGVGKTTLAPTVIHSELARPCVFFDLEGGSFVLDDDPNIDVVPVKSWSELELCMQNLVRNPSPYKSAVFDNMSEALELCKHKHNFYADITKQLSLWNQITNDMVSLFRQGRDLARQEPFVVIYCMWDTTDSEDDMGNKFKHREVALNPKLAEKFMGIMDFVAWLEQPPKPQSPYPPLMHLDIDPLYPTKKRINPRQQALVKIPDIIHNPDLGDVVDTIMGHKEWPAEKHQPPKARTAADVQAAISARRNNTL